MNRTAFITGANGAIGRAIATALAADGTSLVLTDLTLDGLADFAAGLPGRHLILCQDVASAADTVRVAGEAAAWAGGIDIVVASAGIYRDLPLAQLTPGQWAQTIGINLDGVFNTIHALLPHLTEGSAVVTIASVAGHRGSRDHTPYAASKGGVLALTRSLAVELGPRTRVNAVSPGLIDTRMMEALDPARRQAAVDALPLGRLGTADEVASVVAFLCGPGAAYVTGETIHVNGGLYIAS